MLLFFADTCMKHTNLTKNGMIQIAKPDMLRKRRNKINNQ